MLDDYWIPPDAILEAMNVGVYVCDCERKITYWSRKAEAITGWAPGDVLGHSCSDIILSHIDKDGRPLCGKESCPKAMRYGYHHLLYKSFHLMTTAHLVVTDT